MQLQLPPPLRPEHRLTQLVATAAAAPLTPQQPACPHPLITQLQSCTHSKPAWSLQHPSHGSAADLTSLPIHTRKQLLQLDDESQRIRWISDLVASFSGPPQSDAVGHGFNASPTLSASGSSPSSSPLKSPTLAARSMPLLILSPTAVRITLADVQSKVCGPGCPRLFVRLLLASRLPDYLLRLLKWLVQCQTKLAEQKSSRPAEATPASNACVKQIDRIAAHCVFMEEMTWKLLWRLEQLIKSGALSTCVCVLPETAENMFSPWWNHDCVSKVLRIVSSSDPLTETAIFAFVDLMLGVTGIQSIAALTGPAAHHSNKKAEMTRTLKVSLIKEAEMWPNLMFALSHTSPQLTHEALELVSLLLIRLPANAQIVLRQHHWQTSLVPLMSSGGMADSAELRTRVVAAKTLSEILRKELSSSAATASQGTATRRASLTSATPPPTGTKDTPSAESMLATNLKLSLNIWVLLHFACFTAAGASAGDAAAEPSSASSVDSVTGSGESLFTTLCRSFDALEDSLGWLPHTILLVRVLLVSLVTKIQASAACKRAMRGDVHHPSWTALFELMAVCENFLFYSPLVASASAVEQQQAAVRAQAAVELFSNLKTSGGRRTASAMHARANPANDASEAACLARAINTRRFTVVGIHAPTPSYSVGTANAAATPPASTPSSAAMMECDDLILVDRIIDLLTGLRFADLDSSLLAAAAEVTVTDRERLKKIKKRGTEEIEFFQAARNYLAQCGSSSSSGSKKPQTPQDSGDKAAAASPASVVAVAATGSKSIPELLERRRHQRNMADSRFSGMFHSFTRSRRLRSMEAKLSGFVADSQSPEPAATTSLPSAPPRPPRPYFDAQNLSGRHYNLATRWRGKRPAFAHGGHGKINVELAKLKIEAHYLPAGTNRPRTSSAHCLQQHTQPQQQLQRTPPPIPARRPKKGVSVDATPDEETDTGGQQTLLVKISPPPMRSPAHKHSQHQQLQPLSPVAASAAFNPKKGRQWSRVPITNLASLMARPLPDLPVSVARQSSEPSLADKQVTAPIIASPKHSTGIRACEPKEGDDGAEDGDGPSSRAYESSFTHSKQDNEDELIASSAESESDPETESGARHCCCHCNRRVSAHGEYWHLSQLYCRRDFLALFCSCIECGDTIQQGQVYCKIAGVAVNASGAATAVGASVVSSEDIQPLTLGVDEDEFIRARSDEMEEGVTADTLLYHISCLRCTGAHHVAEQTRSDARSESMEEQLAALEPRWFHHAGRTLCLQCYLRSFGTKCAQCQQLITGSGISALGQQWHAACFTCAGDCGRVLSPGEYCLAPEGFVSPPMSPAARSGFSPLHGALKGNKTAFCAVCFARDFNLCHFCHEAIADSEDGVIVRHAGGGVDGGSSGGGGVRKKRPYHRGCYQCLLCLSVNSPSEHLYPGEDDEDPSLYCLAHWLWRFVPHCPTCQEPIVEQTEETDEISAVSRHQSQQPPQPRKSGESVCINDVEYHRECALCHVCKQDLNEPGQQVFTRQVQLRDPSAAASSVAAASPFSPGSADSSSLQILLCAAHHAFDPSTIICGRCDVLMDWREPSVRIADVAYHPACASCTRCQAPLTPATAKLSKSPVISAHSGVLDANGCRLLCGACHALVNAKGIAREAAMAALSATGSSAATMAPRKCPQCSQVIGARAITRRLSNASHYHSACLHCTSCRARLSFDDDDADRKRKTQELKGCIDAQSSKLYCAQHNPDREARQTLRGILHRRG